MEHKKFDLLQSIYLESLTTINDVKFTRREIDILTFFVSGRSAKKAASFFSIAPKTVENHTHNIMLKLDCNSRERIIDFIEKSDKLPALRKFYAALLIQGEFDRSLEKMMKHIQEQKVSCIILCFEKKNSQNFLLDPLITSLKQAGITSCPKIYNGSCSLQDICKEKNVLYLPFKNEKDSLSSENKILSFLFSSTGEPPREIFQEIMGNNFSDLKVQKNYYLLVLTILKELLPNLNLEKTILEFEKQYDILERLIDTKAIFFSLEKNEIKNKKTIFQNILKSKNPVKTWILILFILSLGIFLFKSLDLKGEDIFKPLQRKIAQFLGKNRESSFTRSDFVIPNTALLLNRSALIHKMDTGFEQDVSKIKTVALIGIGGSGKTTLARRYASVQASPIIWEINAQTKESLNISFENLARSFSKTSEDQEKLQRILKIKTALERENQILQFVQNKLKGTPNWFLVYDNVEKFKTLQNYFPTNPAKWGDGKVLLTSRNCNIENNIHINTIIPIGELTNDEKLNLFIKISGNKDDLSFSVSQKEEAQKFLAEIPSFPLDILVAAYYLKATNVSYKDYLENMLKYNQDFSNVQEKILEEAGDYTKTRYGIITLSLKYLIDSNNDFKDLFLFISLLDSQNIPRDLLVKYKNSVVVDNFIYHLKKHSLIINESLAPLPVDSVFSIHRSTQAIILSYLTKTLNLKKDQSFISPLSKVLGTHISDAIDKEDFEKMKTLYRHAESFLDHNDILSQEEKGEITCELGCFYYYLRNSLKAKQLLTEGISVLNSCYPKNNCKIAHFMVYLGNVYRDLGDYEKAKDLFEKSLTLFHQKNAQNYSGMARASGYLGVVYRSLGDFKKAKFFLEKSLLMYEKILENPIGFARSLAHLGSLYRSLGEYEKAKELLEKSLVIYKKYSENHVGAAWVCGDLGHVYIKLGEYKKAKELIDESLMICNKHFFEDHVYVAKALVYLGIFYREKGSYEKAKSLLKKALHSFEKNYGKNHIETNFALQNLGQVYLLENNLENAEIILKKALSIFHKNKYPDEYIILENLAELYQKKSKKNPSPSLKEQEIICLEKALTIVRSNFPENSPHITRIKEKLSKLSS